MWFLKIKHVFSTCNFHHLTDEHWNTCTLYNSNSRQKATFPQLPLPPGTEIQDQTSLHSWTHYENEMEHAHSWWEQNFWSSESELVLCRDISIKVFLFKLLSMKITHRAWHEYCPHPAEPSYQRKDNWSGAQVYKHLLRNEMRNLTKQVILAFKNMNIFAYSNIRMIQHNLRVRKAAFPHSSLEA